MEFYDCDLWSWCQYRNFRPLNPTGFRMLQTSQWGLLDRPTRQDNVDGCCMLLQVRSDCCRKVCVGETFLRTLKRLSPACFLSYGNVFILKWVFQRFWRISTYFNCPNPSKPKTGSLRPLPASTCLSGLQTLSPGRWRPAETWDSGGFVPVLPGMPSAGKPTVLGFEDHPPVSNLFLVSRPWHVELQQ